MRARALWCSSTVQYCTAKRQFDNGVFSGSGDDDDGHEQWLCLRHELFLCTEEEAQHK